MESSSHGALVVSAAEVRRLLPMKQCIALMSDALATLSRGRGVANPLRWGLRLPSDGNILGMMPAAVEDPPLVGLKLVTIVPGNHGSELDAHQGFVVLFDPQRGFPTALVNASEITSIRTAAVSGLATDRLANPEANDLALIGAGIQARSHLLAIQEVRKLRRIRVFSRQRDHCEAFARDMSNFSQVEIETVSSAHEAAAGADIICTTTSARQPVLNRDSVAPGAHLNAVGACIPTAREIDSATIAAARLFVDSRESALAESGDLLLAIADQAVTESHIQAELGEIILGTATGRESATDITIFESLGLGIEDLFAADWVARQAQKENLGQRLDS